MTTERVLALLALETWRPLVSSPCKPPRPPSHRSRLRARTEVQTPKHVGFSVSFFLFFPSCAHLFLLVRSLAASVLGFPRGPWANEEKGRDEDGRLGCALLPSARRMMRVRRGIAECHLQSLFYRYRYYYYYYYYCYSRGPAFEHTRESAAPLPSGDRPDRKTSKTCWSSRLPNSVGYRSQSVSRLDGRHPDARSHRWARQVLLAFTISRRAADALPPSTTSLSLASATGGKGRGGAFSSGSVCPAGNASSARVKIPDVILGASSFWSLCALNNDDDNG
jgi:hypothetical protein